MVVIITCNTIHFFILLKVNGNVVSKAVEVPKESPPDKNLLLKRDTYKRVSNENYHIL